MNKENKIVSIEDALVGLKKPLLLYSIVVVVLNILILVAGVMFNVPDKNESHYSNFETCLYGMREIVNNNPSLNLVNESVIKDLEKTTFKVDSIHLIKMVNSFTCDVFTKDSKGVRRYQVVLEKNSKFPHLYRVFDVKGLKVDSRYQL